MVKQTQALVIGAGPGGYVAAIRLGQLGVKTVLVEKERLGGICLNEGCIPSKALIHLAKLKRTVEEFERFGLGAEGLSIDLAKFQEWKNGVVERLRSGIASLCRGNGVEVIKGEARFVGTHRVRVKTEEALEEIEFENAIIATGSKPIELSGFKFDGERIVTSTEALELKEVPKSFVVIGGGAIGMELGMAYAKLGSNVTVVEIMDQLLLGTDLDLVRAVERNARRLGMRIYLSSRAKAYKNGNVLVQTAEGSEVSVEADKVLVAVGRKPNTEGLGLEAIGVETDAKGFIKVDGQMRTSVPHIFAIGDVRGPPMLAHRASKEGLVAAEVIAGLPSYADFKAIPNVIFTDPEIATVGLTEGEARSKGYDVAIGRFPFLALGRALIANEREGLVKIVADRKSKVVLGVHIAGPEASNLISEAALALEMGATLEDIALTIHPHPTLPEALMEAAEAAKGTPIHILKAASQT